MTPADPNQPLRLLLFDHAGRYRQPLADALCGGEIAAEVTQVETEPAFQVVLAGDWDAIAVAEAALRESDDWMRLAVEISHLGKWQHNFETGVIHFDERAGHHYGFATPTVTLGMVLQQVHPDDVSLVAAKIASTSASASDGRYSTEYRVIHPDSSIHWLAVEAQIYFAGEGSDRHPTNGFGTSQDITARKQAEADEHERRLLAEAMRDSLAALTSSLDVETVMEQLLAVSARVVPSAAGAIVLFSNQEGRVAYSRGHAPQSEAFFKANPILFDPRIYTQSSDGQLYYLAADTRSMPSWTTFPETEWIRSSVGVQIVLNGRPIGFLTADSAVPNQYGQQDVENLQTFARYAALALQNAHHVDQLEQRVLARTAELEATKTQVEAILDNSPDGILLIHADLTIQQANHAFHQLFACEPAACHGQSLLQRIDQADIAQVKALLQTVITTAQRNQLEIHAVRRDGTTFDAELSVGVIKDDGLVCIIRDITARKAQERQLHYHASLQKTVSDAVIVTDMASRVQSWNQAAERIYGWSAAEAAGRTMGELVRTQFAFPEERAYLLERLQAQGWWYGEFIQQRKDGQICHILSSAALVNDEQGNPIGMVAVNHDITERKQAEDAFQKSAAEIRDLYNNAPCGYHSLDQDGLIVQINDTELRWLGYTRAEVVGRLKFTDIITTASMQVFQKNFPLFKARGWVNDLEFELVRKDGTTQPVLLSSTAINDDGHYVQSRSTLFDITELRQAQQAIVASEARYRLLAENVFDMVSRYNVEGDFLYVSPSTEQLLGYSPDELVGRRGFNMFYPDQWAQMGALLGQASQPDRQPAPQIFRVRHKAGHDILLELNVRGIFSEESGTLIEFVSSGRDVTEQKRAEAALRASEEKFRQVAENFDHLLIIRAVDTSTMLYVNSAAERLTGLTREKLYADPQSILNHIHPDDLAAVRQEEQSPAFLAEGRADLEYRFIRPDGHIRWFRVRTFPIKDESGTIVSRVGTSEDITERKQAELALQASEAKYRSLIETMRGGLVMFDTADRITFVNDRFCELTAYPRNVLIGSSPLAYVDAANATKMKAQFARRHQLENTSYEFLMQRPDGQSLYLLAQGSPLLDEAGNYNGSFSIVTDITAQKQAEAALRQALAKEQELGELKSRFVSVASHEFRTPLATISATTETLITYRDRLDSNQLEARLHKILAQVEHMKEIMEDVLQLARIQAGRVDFIPAVGDLKALCNEIIEEFRSRHEYQDRIVTNTAGAPLNFCFDARLMRHVISNLITNGLKYSPTAQPITVNLDRATKTIILQVIDHGIGIPDADLKHIFEPFHRASNVGTISGTGLGLSITKEAVNLHGGIIQIDTQINTGTTFTVSLPITPERITTDVKNPDY